jgi:hypothetical protein
MKFIKLFENFENDDDLLDIIKFRVFEDQLDIFNITDQRDNYIGDIHIDLKYGVSDKGILLKIKYNKSVYSNFNMKDRIDKIVNFIKNDFGYDVVYEGVLPSQVTNPTTFDTEYFYKVIFKK